MAVGLRHLRYFVEVAEAGQVTRAAEALHVSQPAVSQAVRELEHELGGRLLERHAGGVRATGNGGALLRDARRTLALVDDALAAARAAGRVEAARLRVGFLPFALEIIQGLLAPLRERRPDVIIEMRQHDFATQTRALLAGELDGEFLSYLPDHPDLVAVPVLYAPVVACMAETHRLAGCETLTFADIADETWPGRHPTVPEEWADAYWLTERRGRRPRVSVQTPVTPEEVWTLIASGEAICTAPRWSVETLLGRPLRPGLGITAIPLTDVEPFVIALARHRETRAPLVLELFADVTQAAAELNGR